MKAEIKNDPVAYSKQLRFKMWLYGLYAKILAKIWMQKHKWGTVIWFAKRTIEAMRGKIGVIDSREVYSKGGFKYYQCEISKFPFNKDADYSKF